MAAATKTEDAIVDHPALSADDFNAESISGPLRISLMCCTLLLKYAANAQLRKIHKIMKIKRPQLGKRIAFMTGCMKKYWNIKLEAK